MIMATVAEDTAVEEVVATGAVATEVVEATGVVVATEAAATMVVEAAADSEAMVEASVPSLPLLTIPTPNWCHLKKTFTLNTQPL